MKKFFTINTINPLVFSLPERAVLARLGYNRYLNQLSGAMEVRIRLAMQKAFALCHPRGRWKLLRVEEVTAEQVVLSENWSIAGSKFAGFVQNTPLVWLGGVTIGDDINGFIAKNPDNMTDCAVYDAVGSECADRAIAVLQQLAAAELRRFNLVLSSQRFSIGYGGVSLQHQQEFFRQLDLAGIGMSLTASCIMQPEKSVTAFALVNRVD